MKTQHSLFDPINMGKITLSNRIVMAPMTRSRADANHTPSELAIEYYKQRANAGLIITEGTSPSPNGDGYTRVPGVYNEAQIKAWQKITKAVHDEGGRIFLQMMHVGRIAHPLNKAPHAETVAPSAIRAAGKMYTDQEGMQDFAMPRELKTEEIALVIEEYKQATKNALDSGFDGVEFHAAAGYLPMQFLSSNSNLRTDQYGGSVANRIRFVIEALEAMSSIAGADKIGIRIWPGTEFNDMHDANPVETYTELAKALNPLHLAYLHIVGFSLPDNLAYKLMREHYKGLIIANGGFDFASGQAMLDSGLADMISYATLYLANPDLVERFKRNGPYNQADNSTFYTPGAKGYIDYPALAELKR